MSVQICRRTCLASVYAQAPCMIDKRISSMELALAGLVDGARVMINGFGGAGTPLELIKGLEETGACELVLLLNSLRYVDSVAPRIFAERRVRGAVTTAVRAHGRATSNFEQQWLDGDLEVELVPQGTFVERIRAGGAGIAAFYTPTGIGTELAKGKEVREFDGKFYLLETALTADFALLRAARADRWGNISCRGTQANFGPAMATAATVTVVEVDEIVDGPLPPADIHIPGIFVQRVIELPIRRAARSA